MNDLTDLPTGIEPGLRFAVVLDGRGGGHELDWPGVAAWRPGDGFLWIHLERDTQPAAAWMHGASGIDPIVADSLLAEDSRPRIEEFDEALLLVMRGVNLAEKEEVELVPVHMWLDEDRAITPLVAGDLVRGQLFRPEVVAISLILGGVAIIFLERRSMPVRFADVDAIECFYRRYVGVGLLSSQ